MKTYNYAIHLDTFEIEHWEGENVYGNVDAIYDEEFDCVRADSIKSFLDAKQMVYNKCLSLAHTFNQAAQEVASHDNI